MFFNRTQKGFWKNVERPEKFIPLISGIEINEKVIKVTWNPLP